MGWCQRFRLLAISHETIYRRILKDRKRGGTLWTHLRVVTKKYRTLVERKSGFLAIGQLDCCGAPEVTARLKQIIDAQPRPVRTLTLDNGTEFHSYKKLEAVVDTTCYFATPHHSWERGSNENTNGLIRQYLKKGTSMEHITQDNCQRIADKLNRRPRKRLGFRTPEEVYAA